MIDLTRFPVEDIARVELVKGPVLRIREGNHFKLELRDYHDDAGTPGRLKFRWQQLP